MQGELRLSESDLAADDGAVKAGKLLSANRLVLGSFQLAGGEILINGRFVSTQSGVVGPGQTFQLRGRLDRLFDLYPKLTERVLGVLGVEVAGKTAEAVAAVQPVSQSLPAQELYVQGREAFHERTAAGYRRAVELLKKATDEDPGYALAFAALGEAQAELGAQICAPLRSLQFDRGKRAPCHVPMFQPSQDELAGRLGFKDRAAARAKVMAEAAELRKECERLTRLALSSATTAASLLPALPAAHRALALAHLRDGQRQKAEVEARTLLNLNRADPMGFLLLGLVSADPEESRGHHRRSLELDPRLGDNLYQLASWDYNEGKEDEALRRLDEAARLLPGEPEVHALRAELLLRAGRDRDAALAADAALRLQPAHARALFVRAMARWRAGGPARPWDARLKWREAAALDLFQARLWEPELCRFYEGTSSLDVWEVVLPERLRRGEPWKAMRRVIRELQEHLWDLDRNLKEQTAHCGPGDRGKVIFLDAKDGRRPVTEWRRGMLRHHEDPKIIDRWWNDRSWNQFVFTAVVCAGRPVTPDEQVRAELLLDGKAQPVFWPLSPEGRELAEGDRQEGMEGAPGRFVRPRAEFAVRGRLRFQALRPALEDGARHRVTLRVRAGGRALAEGHVPFFLVDPQELKD